MQDLKVALVQCSQHWENKEANLLMYAKWFDKLPSNIDLVLLPEMFQTGFTMNVDLAEDWASSSSLTWLKQMAAKHQLGIYTSLLIRDSCKVYNRGVFIDSEMNVNVYDKRKCFGLAGEDQVIQAGNSEQIVEFKGWKIALQICYDLRFPEIMRNGMMTDQCRYDVLAFVANWPAKRVLHWESLLRARAIENQCYVLGNNRVGEDKNGHLYSGSSMMVDPLGNEMKAKDHQEELLLIDLQANHLKQVRAQLPFLQDI